MTERVSVDLPAGLLRRIEIVESNREGFIVEAIQRELERRLRLDLQRSMRNPHPESRELADLGFQEWFESLPEEDTESLVDMSKCRPVRWIPDIGWIYLDEIDW